MTEKKKLWTIIGTGVVVAGGLGGLIYYQHTKVEEAREKAAGLTREIEAGRTLISSTPDLEREVITQRETDSVVAEILPGDEDINNFVRTLRNFEEDSGVKIVSLKEKTISDREQLEFDRVAYTLSLDGDAFQLLSFLDEVESHARFMSVTNMKLTAARSKRGSSEQPRHKITLDVETYVYEPQDGGEPVKVENYDRKRDLLMSEITRRRAELTVNAYEYRGPRGRRDPWIDPRVPVGDDGQLVLSIEQQIALVDELVERMALVETAWQQVVDAPNLIAKMKTRADFDHQLTMLEEEVRRVTDENQLVFIPAERRFHSEVVTALEELRRELSDDRGGFGPSVAELKETLAAMDRHFERGEFELGLQAFRIIEPGLEVAERDDVRGPLAMRLREKSDIGLGVLDFNRIPLVINGVALHEDLAPVAIINGKSIGVGEMLPGTEVIVQGILKDEIEFNFRGLTLIRRIHP